MSEQLISGTTGAQMDGPPRNVAEYVYGWKLTETGGSGSPGQSTLSLQEWQRLESGQQARDSVCKSREPRLWAPSEITIARANGPGEESTAKLRPLVAILGFRGETKLEEQLSTPLRAYLKESGKLRIIDEDTQNKIINAEAKSLKNCYSLKCAAEIGQLLSADKVITGQLFKWEETYTLNIHYVDVATGVIEHSAVITCKCRESDFPVAVKNLVNNLLATLDPDNSSSPQDIYSVQSMEKRLELIQAKGELKTLEGKRGSAHLMTGSGILSSISGLALIFLGAYQDSEAAKACEENKDNIYYSCVTDAGSTTRISGILFSLAGVGLTVAGAATNPSDEEIEAAKLKVQMLSGGLRLFQPYLAATRTADNNHTMIFGLRSQF